MCPIPRVRKRGTFICLLIGAIIACGLSVWGLAELQAERASRKYNAQLEQDWQNALRVNTTASMNEFIEKYPFTKQKQQAVGNMPNAIWNEVIISDTYKAYDDYLRRYPNGPYVDKGTSKNPVLD